MLEELCGNTVLWIQLCWDFFTQKVGEAEAIFSNVFHRLKAKKTIRMEYRMEFPSLWDFFSNSLKNNRILSVIHFTEGFFFWTESKDHWENDDLKEKAMIQLAQKTMTCFPLIFHVFVGCSKNSYCYISWNQFCLPKIMLFAVPLSWWPVRVNLTFCEICFAGWAPHTASGWMFFSCSNEWVGNPTRE